MSNVISRLVDATMLNGVSVQGLYQHLDQEVGAGSQDEGNEERRFESLVNGHSVIGNQIKKSWSALQAIITEQSDIETMDR